MSRQIEIDSHGVLSKADGGYIECPLNIKTKDESFAFCNENCAWIQIIEGGTILCGTKLIGELTIKRNDK